MSLEYFRSVCTLLFSRKRLFVTDTSDERWDLFRDFFFPLSSPLRIFPYCLKKLWRFWGFIYLTLGIMSKVGREVFCLIIFSGYIWALAGWLCNFPISICYGNVLLGGTVHVKTWFVWQFCLWLFSKRNQDLEGSPMQRRLQELAHRGCTSLLKCFKIHLSYHILK